jgi:L,D-peptidoglycan transpeptidase YkuD (ErfK/YbiS/YcfS/YnhG family)
MTQQGLTVYHSNNAQPHLGILQLDGRTIPCALGKHGLIAAQDKREGDGCTPIGSWALRRCFVRADKLPAPLPATALETHIITRDMGWCDDVVHPLYNQLFVIARSEGDKAIQNKDSSGLPRFLNENARNDTQNSYETLWRDEDDCYDIIIELGYNDDPIVAGRGSAIFFHCSKLDAHGKLHHTEGCVAIPKETMLEILPLLRAGMMIEILQRHYEE